MFKKELLLIFLVIPGMVCAKGEDKGKQHTVTIINSTPDPITVTVYAIQSQHKLEVASVGK